MTTRIQELQLSRIAAWFVAGAFVWLPLGAQASPGGDDDGRMAEPPPVRQVPPPILPPRTPPPDDAPPVRKGHEPPITTGEFHVQRGRRLTADPERPATRPRDWPRHLDAIETLLRAERWRDAQQDAKRLITEILQHDSSATRPALARAVALLAIADAQQGVSSRAAWRWATAIAIHPPIAEKKLATFGDAGRWLATIGARRAGQVPSELQAYRRPWPDDLEPARLKSRPTPHVLIEASEWRKKPVHTVEIVVDRWGQLSYPVVVDADRAHPALLYILLEAIWQRRPAAPATRSGERVAVVQEFRIAELFPDLDRRGRW